METGCDIDIYYDVWMLLRKIGISDEFMKEYERSARDKIPLISGADCTVLRVMRSHYNALAMVESALQTDEKIVVDEAMQTDLAVVDVPEVDGALQQSAHTGFQANVRTLPPSEGTSVGRECSSSSALKRQRCQRPQSYGYPKWLTQVYAAPSPYFPQMGDVVFYFRRRHEMYLREMFKPSGHRGKKRQREEPDPDLRDIELFKVVDVQFITKEPDYIPYAEIRLRRLSLDDNHVEDGTMFTIRYQDVKDIEDVFVLAQTVDRSKNRAFHIGNRVRAVFEDKGVMRWLNGRIVDIIHDEKVFPLVGHLNSIFVVLDARARQANAVPDALSSWDLVLLPKEEVENGTVLNDGYQDGLRVDRSELQSMAYLPVTKEWDGVAAVIVATRIRLKFEDILLRPETTRYRLPVDLENYPEYYKQIAYPMDMGTIVDRLKYGFYRRKAALLYDVHQLKMNAKKFDGFQDEDIKNAEIIAAICEDVIADPDMGLDVDEVWDRKRAELNGTMV